MPQSSWKHQNLANTAWAFATVGHKDERLFSTLAAAAERRMRDFNSQNLANIAWACENICSVEAAASLGFH